MSLLVEQFQDKLVQVLLAVAALSAVLAAFENDLHAFAEPVVILSILILNALVGVWQTLSAEGSLDALKRLQPEYATVLRDGKWISDLPTREIVPGDILSLRVGDRVPADGRVLSLKTATFSTDEGSLTGESMTVQKTSEAVDVSVSTIPAKVNMVFSGTVVTNGRCFVMATNTGSYTEIGTINQGVQAAKEENMKTPLTLKLDEFGEQMSHIIGALCIVVWSLSIPKFGNDMFKSRWNGAIYYAKIAVALGVAAIPEGLPAVITLCLSLGTRRMAKRNVIVRKLSSVETLGCTSVICTDKTGTLTTNKMTVKSLVTMQIGVDSDVAFVERGVEGISYDPIGAVEGGENGEIMNSSTLRLFASICALCNEAKIEYKVEEGGEGGTYERVGEPTEAALKVLVEKLRLNGDEHDMHHSDDPSILASQYNSYWASKYELLAILEFSRDRKSMGVLLRHQGESKSHDIHYTPLYTLYPAIHTYT